MDVSADANTRRTSITDDPPALPMGPHATAMLPSYHPDPRHGETFSLPYVEPGTPWSPVSDPYRLDPEIGFHVALRDRVPAIEFR
jgi:hypothetical protein